MKDENKFCVNVLSDQQDLSPLEESEEDQRVARAERVAHDRHRDSGLCTAEDTSDTRERSLRLKVGYRVHREFLLQHL